MRILTLFLFFSNAVQANFLSYGTGTETCNWAVTDTKNQRVFNCDEVNISGGATISFNASNFIVIMSRGDVVIDGDIDVSATGNIAGPGGSNGGTCPAAATCDANNGGAKQGGEGIGGRAGVPNGNNASGGGGSGASFGAGAATDGTDGTASGAGALGAGGIAANTTYFPEASFTSNFTGGAGGGAGGSGEDGFGIIGEGGNGGGGGGGLIIIAKGSVTINGNILANGANGLAGAAGAGQAGGGGGGSGSGGAIYIIGNGGVTFNSSVSAAGGASGGLGGSTGFENGGAGGVGSIGRIRIDSPTGTFVGAGTANAGLTIFQSTIPYIYDPLENGQTFKSDIEAACSYREIDTKSFLYSFLLGFFTVLLFLGISKGTRHLRY